MTTLTKKQEETRALHALNYGKIRDGLFNVIKWHDNGTHTYMFNSTDLFTDNNLTGKQLRLDISNPLNGERITYGVTYYYGSENNGSTVIIEQLDLFGDRYPLNNLAHPSKPEQTNKMYDILYHVEKTIKQDLQTISQKQKQANQ